MVETIGSSYIEKNFAPDNKAEKAQEIGITSIAHTAGESYVKFQQSGKLEAPDTDEAAKAAECTRNWLGFIETHPDNAFTTPVKLHGRDKDSGDNGKDMYVGLQGSEVFSAFEGADFGNAVTVGKLDSLIVKKGNMVSVTYSIQTSPGKWESAPNPITIPVSVLQQSHLLTHTDAHLSGHITVEQRAVIQAYVAERKGVPNSIDSLNDADMEKAAKDTPAITSEATRKYIDSVVAQAAVVVGKVEGNMLTRIDELTALRKKMESQLFCSPVDMAEIIRITTTKEFIGQEGMVIKDMDIKSDTLRSQLRNIDSDLKNTGDEAQRTELEQARNNLQKELNEVTIQRTLVSKLGNAEVTAAVNKVFATTDKETLTRINKALESGDIQGIVAEAITQLDKKDIGEEKKVEARKRINEFKEKALIAGGGMLLLLLIMIMQSTDKK